jgi:hypothetical protein
MNTTYDGKIYKGHDVLSSRQNFLNSQLENRNDRVQDPRNAIDKMESIS